MFPAKLPDSQNSLKVSRLTLELGSKLYKLIFTSLLIFNTFVSDLERSFKPISTMFKFELEYFDKCLSKLGEKS